MRSWYDGYCHTFDPKETQRRSWASKLSLYLGHREILKNYKGVMFRQFNVVIEEKITLEINSNYNIVVHSLERNILVQE